MRMMIVVDGATRRLMFSQEPAESGGATAASPRNPLANSTLPAYAMRCGLKTVQNLHGTMFSSGG